MKQFEELKLPPGASVQLSITAKDGKSYNLETVYIGGLALHSIIIATPSLHPQINWQANTKVAVSIMMATGVAAFNTKIELVSTKPYGHLHLTYPKSVNFREFRGAARVKVELAASVAKNDGSTQEKRFRSRILDISVSGLKLATDSRIGDIGNKLTIHVMMFFAGVERSVSIHGVIRAQLAGSGGVDMANVYGIKFLPMNDDKKVLLHAFVLNGLQAGSVAGCDVD